MSIYDNELIIPADITLSESAWSELITQIRTRPNCAQQHNLEQLISNPTVPECLKADMLEEITWLQFESDLQGIWEVYGCSLFAAYGLRDGEVQRIHDWLLHQEQTPIRSRAFGKLLTKMKVKLRQNLPTRDPRHRTLVHWIEKIKSLVDTPIKAK